MKHKQTYFTLGSTFLVIFMMLGYVVKFYPEAVTGLDSSIQLSVRGDLPAHLTVFFKVITNFGHEALAFVYTFAIAAFFYFRKNWKTEGLLLAGNLVLMGAFSTVFKYLYNRPRPSLEFLVKRPMGPSFPSWHAASSMIVAISLMIIIEQHLTKTVAKRLLQVLVLVLALLTAVSRIYLGVHYPTDILGGWLLALAISLAVYPIYDKGKRFMTKICDNLESKTKFENFCFGFSCGNDWFDRGYVDIKLYLCGTTLCPICKKLADGISGNCNILERLLSI